jgi:8-oxo-dGTP diphosphatase
VVRAAGGLVVKKTKKGNLKFLVAHRPSYDDWSLPKGKAENGESPLQTAVREVLEETGYKCRVVGSLGTTRHRVDGGVKEVHWFAMRPLPASPGFKKNAEVDRIRWVSAKQAGTVLDYANDLSVLDRVELRGLTETGTLRLLRHAAAGDRSKWDGDDVKRPLTKKGNRQADQIALALADADIDRIVTSPYKRCVQTVEPIAKITGASIETSSALSEEADIDEAYQLVDSCVGYNAVICSHGDVIPAVINRMMWAGLDLESRFYCSKGSIWEIDVEHGQFSVGRYVPPPE